MPRKTGKSLFEIMKEDLGRDDIEPGWQKYLLDIDIREGPMAIGKKAFSAGAHHASTLNLAMVNKQFAKQDKMIASLLSENKRLREINSRLREALGRIANTLEEEHDGETFEVTFMHAQKIAADAIAKIEVF